jgi:hypothetical protein
MAKDAKGHGSEARGSAGRIPIAGHAFHSKTNDQLRYIAKDASAAAQASRGLSSYNPNSGKREDTEGKYLDQMNNALTVLGFRERGGRDFSAESHTRDIADQHGIDTSHLEPKG